MKQRYYIHILSGMRVRVTLVTSNVVIKYQVHSKNKENAN